MGETTTPARDGVDVAPPASAVADLGDLPLFAASPPVAVAGSPPPTVNGTARPDPVVATGTAPHRSREVDWALVRAFRQQVADRLAKEVERREGP